MLILEADGAPIRMLTKPGSLITHFAKVAKKHKVTFAPITPKAHNTSARSSDASDMLDLEETTTDDESMSDNEGESSDEANRHARLTPGTSIACTWWCTHPRHDIK